MYPYVVSCAPVSIHIASHDRNLPQKTSPEAVTRNTAPSEAGCNSLRRVHRQCLRRRCVEKNGVLFDSVGKCCDVNNETEIDESGRCGTMSHAILILGSTFRPKPPNPECLVFKVDGKLAIKSTGAELS